MKPKEKSLRPEVEVYGLLLLLGYGAVLVRAMVPKIKRGKKLSAKEGHAIALVGGGILKLLPHLEDPVRRARFTRREVREMVAALKEAVGAVNAIRETVGAEPLELERFVPRVEVKKKRPRRADLQ